MRQSVLELIAAPAEICVRSHLGPIRGRRGQLFQPSPPRQAVDLEPARRRGNADLLLGTANAAERLERRGVLGAQSPEMVFELSRIVKIWAHRAQKLVARKTWLC